jgi:hypothetical protein
VNWLTPHAFVNGASRPGGDARIISVSPQFAAR